MNVRDKKGSITIFVLVGLLFMTGFLIISFGSNINKSKIAKEQFEIISSIYSKGDSDAEAYERAYTALRRKNAQEITVDNGDKKDTSTLELTKTLYGPIKNYKIYGNSVQDTETYGTPSPTNPVKVESVGKYIEQLYNKDDLIQGYIKSDGTVESVTWYYCTDYIEVSGSHLTYSNCVSTNSNLRYYAFYDENKTYISGAIQKAAEDGAVTYTITIPSNAKYFRCNISPGNVDIAQIDLGKEITNSEIYGKYRIPIKVSGKNLLNYPNGLEWTGVYTIATDIYLEQGDYTISYKTTLQGGSEIPGILVQGKNGATGGWCYLESATITLSGGTYSVLAYSNGRSGTNSTGITSKIEELILCKGTSTEYVPYVEPKLFDIYINEPLRKAGDYADYIDFSTGKVFRNVGKTLLSEYSWFRDTGVGFFQTHTGLYNYKPSTSYYTDIGIMSENFIVGTANSEPQGNYYICTTINNSSLRIRVDEMANVEEFESTFANSKVYYRLATPDSTETIELPELRAYEDYTNIEVLTEVVPSKIEATYYGYTFEK